MLTTKYHFSNVLYIRNLIKISFLFLNCGLYKVSVTLKYKLHSFALK